MQKVSIISPATDKWYYKACYQDCLRRHEAPIVNPSFYPGTHNQFPDDKALLRAVRREWLFATDLRCAVYIDNLDWVTDEYLHILGKQPDKYSFRAFMGPFDLPSYDLELVYDPSDTLFYCACYEANIYLSGNTPKQAIEDVKHEFALHYS